MKFNDSQLQEARDFSIHTLLGTNNTGRYIQMRCPLEGHADKSPSFTLYPNNSYHCFGCAKHGNNCVDFVMDLTGCDFYQAVKEITEHKYGS